LFYGPEGSGKERGALAFAKALNCSVEKDDFCGKCSQCIKIDHYSHPDVHYLFPMPSNVKEEDVVKILKEKREDHDAVIRFNRISTISIQHVRMLQRELQLKPFESKMKLAIIRDVDNMKEETANAFLKTLEEPPSGTVIILITSRLSSLLPTMISRCHKLYFRPFVGEELITQLIRKGFEENTKLHTAVSLSSGNLAQTIEMMRGDFFEEQEIANDLLEKAYNKERFAIVDSIEKLSLGRNFERVRSFLTFYLVWFRDLLVMMEGSSDVLLTIPGRNEKLNRHLKYHSRKGLIKALTDIEHYRRALNQNVNLKLVLILFLLRLQEGEYA
jgi:DNA polymerase-3 subunit delta'